MDECFLCCEGNAPLFRVCACKQVVHEECFQRLITVPAHRDACPVCTRPYSVETRVTRRCLLLPSVCHVSAMYMVVFWCFFVLEVIVRSSPDPEPITLFEIFAAFLALHMLVRFHYLHYEQTRHYCCWTLEDHSERHAVLRV